ncbi:beta-ketoacyl-[acyl-carrier-protein] synthase family protein [Rubritalea sp.]|uniref:beta-ketoacyl-[acyl-carrier-protein] synthase family protein n=1 Tax=Rubritalea sp. TaxID=2109375 RepID=UPI003EF67FB2
MSDPSSQRPNNSRVFITGIGMISPMGKTLEDHLRSVKAGSTHFREVDFFDVSRQRVKTAALVDLPESLGEHHLSEKELGRLDRGTKLMLYATGEALNQAGLSDIDPHTPMVVGTSAGAMPIGEAYFKAASIEPLSRRGQVSRVEHYQPQKGMAMIQRAFDFRAQTQIISNACASGANAIGHAYQLIKSGQRPVALAGGYDGLSEMVFSGFNSLQALSLSGIPRPFDAKREGLALGEGAAMFVLETEESMLERGATPLAEIIGYGMATDLHHLTQPHPEGKAAISSMKSACKDAKVEPSEIQYINSHGTGTPLNDVAEANAISTWAGADAEKMMVSSTKSAMGHALGGAGAIEAGLCLMALREQVVPASLNVRTLDSACRFDLVTEPRSAQLDTVLTNSFGFGGCNATLILRKINSPS